MGEIRRNASEGEKLVYYELGRLGLYPEVQHPIDRVHVDFAFPEDKLICEINGSSHRLEEMQIKDSKRNYFLQMEGWRIYIFTENEAVHNPLNVAAKIKRALEKQREDNNNKLIPNVNKIKNSISNVVENIGDYVDKSIVKTKTHYANTKSNKVNTQKQTYYCNMCGKTITQRGNCLRCNIKLKKARESQYDER